MSTNEEYNKLLFEIDKIRTFLERAEATQSFDESLLSMFREQLTAMENHKEKLEKKGEE